MNMPNKDSETQIEELNLELVSEADMAKNINLPQSANTVMERRKVERHKPPQTGIKNYIRKKIDALVDYIDADHKRWIVFILLILISIALLFNTLVYRANLVDDNYLLSSELAKHQADLQALAAQWSQEEMRLLKESISNAESRVFSDYAKLANWLNTQALAAQQLELNLRYTMGQVGVSEIKNVVTVPIEIALTANDAAARQAYLRMLQFLRNMVNDQWHLEIASAMMRSENQGVSQMQASLNMWVREIEIDETGYKVSDNETIIE